MPRQKKSIKIPGAPAPDTPCIQYWAKLLASGNMWPGVQPAGVLPVYDASAPLVMRRSGAKKKKSAAAKKSKRSRSHAGTKKRSDKKSKRSRSRAGAKKRSTKK